MSDFSSRWPRTHWVPGGAPARIAMFAFSAASLPVHLALDRTRYGAPAGQPPPELQVLSVMREQAPQWFGGFFADALGKLARDTLGARYDALTASRVCHTLMGTFPDPADLGYLQWAWVFARWACDHSAIALLDAYPTRWFAAGDVVASGAEGHFELGREVSFLAETELLANGLRMINTRGMAKFGRPDLIMLVAPSELERAPRILQPLADALAMGAMFAEDQQLCFEDGTLVRFERYRPGSNAPELSLNNEGLLVRAIPAWAVH